MNKQRSKRGQAALEFLSTYGFAFLIILVMIGALSYFGVLNPGNLLPERCNVDPALNCQEFQLGETGTDDVQVQVRLSNQLGQTMDDISVTMRSGDTESTSCVAITERVRPGESFTIDCTIPELYVQGERLRADYVITHTPVGRSFEQQIAGDVFARMQ